MLDVLAVNKQVSALMRKPEEVMKLNRLGSAHQCPLSFMRTLLRRLKQDQWQFHRAQWQMDADGVGYAVYQAVGPVNTYSLVAFSHQLADELRSDRVIAEAWDATFVLFDGVPDDADIVRLQQNVPLQEAGRISDTELSLSRANRSDRLFDYVVDSLADGQQPERSKLEAVGYLMRTTAVYGSGKFGAADREQIKDRLEMAGPFQVEMLTVWLIRAFTVDLAEFLAQVKGGANAVTLVPEIKRCIGVGNSTGLGMAPFLVNHPTLLNQWMIARESALARVRALKHAKTAEVEKFKCYVLRAQLNVKQWRSSHPLQQQKLAQLLNDLEHLQHYVSSLDFRIQTPWDHLYRWSEAHLSLEGQEQLAMLMMEPYVALIEDLTQAMAVDETQLPLIDGRLAVGDMMQLIEDQYAWALSVDYDQADSCSKFWYVSEEKLEPRLGQRFDEPGADLEQPLCIGRHVFQLYQALNGQYRTQRLAEFLIQHPVFRHVVRRIQQCKDHPYMEIQDNLIASDILPIDMLRLKLSFFGATRFDPRSDRWVRINMFQYAPFPHELSQCDGDDWVLPQLASR